MAEYKSPEDKIREAVKKGEGRFGLCDACIHRIGYVCEFRPFRDLTSVTKIVSCSELKWWKEHEPKDEPDLYTTYQVSLITKTRRKHMGVRGVVTHRAGPLNFCPECGRPLKRKKIAK